MTRTRLVLFALVAVAVPLAAQDRAVTLAEAIALSERTQPSMVQAQSDVRTADAQRRNAWGAFLPSVTASSSASDFFSEGASRIDPITGQLTSGNSTNRSISTSLSASLDLFTGFRRGAEMRAARAGQTEAQAALVDTRFQQALATTNQFFDALAASAAGAACGRPASAGPKSSSRWPWPSCGPARPRARIRCARW